MIELNHDQLRFSFREVHPQARLSIEFQRTLRIPDDDKTYFLPPGLGRFPLKHVDDHAQNVPRQWSEHGGVMLPMYQSEALWLNFSGDYLAEHNTRYPFAVKVAAGKINAVTGETWSNGLTRHPQDYLVWPAQPWLDGYCVRKGVIRQFVAMPLGAGYSAEEQITGQAEHGGLQLVVYPMKREVFERRFPKRAAKYRVMGKRALAQNTVESCLCEMGLAPGGQMKQEIYNDPFDLDDWDLSHRSRCFVHIANSLVWEAITGQRPPTTPPAAKQYTKAGLPWFDYYNDQGTAVEGSSILERLKSVLQIGKTKGDVPLPENEPVSGEAVIHLTGSRRGVVREGTF
jgi:hypothetical protein